MVSTRARTQSKNIETPLEAAAGSGIRAPARRNRTKKVDPEAQREEKPKAATKKAVAKSRTKVSAEPELRDENLHRDAPKTENRSRSRATMKPTSESEVKITKRTTRATPASVVTETKEKTRQTSRIVKAKDEKPVMKATSKAAPKEKPKASLRKGSKSKTQAAREQGDGGTTPGIVLNSDDGPKTCVELSREAEIPEDEKTEGSLQNTEPLHLASQSPTVPHSSRLPLFAAPSQPASPKRAAEQTLQTQLGTTPFLPPRSSVKCSATKFSATTNLFRSSALVSPEKSLGSPRKPLVIAKLLSSPAKARTGSPTRTPATSYTSSASTAAAAAAAAAATASSRQPKSPIRPALRPVASESQLSASKQLFNISAPSNRPSTSSGPTSPTKSSLKVAGCLSPKKSVTFHDRSTPRQSPLPPQTAPVILATPPTPRPVILAGLVFYVDVQDRNGADASSLFVPLLLDLGARVVAHWASNTDPITHVLFKDGDLMTLEKVVASNGAVKAINVGWVLDCERERKKINEGDYLIDLPNVPGLCTPGKPSVCSTPRMARGTTPSKGVREEVATPMPTEPLREIEFPTIAGLRIKTPSFKVSMGVASTTMTPFVPGTSIGMVQEDKENVSPTQTEMMETPLHQKSCPPKQANMPLFPTDLVATPVKKLTFGNQKRRETMAFGF